MIKKRCSSYELCFKLSKKTFYCDVRKGEGGGLEADCVNASQVEARAVNARAAEPRYAAFIVLRRPFPFGWASHRCAVMFVLLPSGHIKHHRLAAAMHWLYFSITLETPDIRREWLTYRCLNNHTTQIFTQTSLVCAERCSWTCSQLSETTLTLRSACNWSRKTNSLTRRLSTSSPSCRWTWRRTAPLFWPNLPYV